MKNEIGYKCLYKTDYLEVGGIYENVYLTNNRTKEYIYIGSFYGDATCAFISENNSWCVVGGDILILFRDCKSLKINEIKDVFDLKLIDENNIQILTHPWSVHSSIWQLNIESLEYTRIQIFDKYKDKEYTENIEW